MKNAHHLHLKPFTLCPYRLHNSFCLAFRSLILLKGTLENTGLFTFFVVKVLDKHTNHRPTMSKKKPNPDENEKPRVHKDLEGFDIQINSFGEITTSYDIDKINQFLNKTVDDKKLRHRDDLKTLRGETPSDEKASENEGLNLDEETDFEDETTKR